MKKIFLVLFLFSLNQTFCQNIDDENSKKAYAEVYGKCFKDLKPIEGTKDILPSKKDISFCSLYQCVSRIGYAEGNKNTQKAILKRAIEITTLLYKQGTPIYLLSGMDSSGTEIVENKNLTDDNNLIYIAVAECLTSQSLEKIKDIVNEQTMKLINKK
jgi:hypothetical protein